MSKGIVRRGEKTTVVRLSTAQRLPSGVVLPPFSDRKRVLRYVASLDSGLGILAGIAWVVASLGVSVWLEFPKIMLAFPLVIPFMIAAESFFNAHFERKLKPYTLESTELAETLNSLGDRIQVLGDTQRDTLEPLWDEIVSLASSEFADTDTAVQAVSERVESLERLVASLEESAAALAAELDRTSGAAELARVEREHAQEVERVEREFREAKAAELLSEFSPDTVSHADQLSEIVDSVRTELSR